MKTASRLLFGLLLALFLPVLALGQDCFPNGDVNSSGDVTPADLILLLNCAIGGSFPCPPLPAGDLNCDGFRDLADAVLEFGCVYLGAAPLGPCPIANVRPLAADPLDSIIVQPRIIYPPGTGDPYTSLRVWIRNKDTLSGVTLLLSELQTEAPAYAVLAPDSFAVTRLTSTLTAKGVNQNSYLGVPPGPDPFMTVAYTPEPRFGNGEPPNSTRKALWDINFDEVLGPCGTIEFDSLALFLENTIAFVDVNFRRVPVNFQMGKLAVKGDVTGDGFLMPSDVVMELNCTFVGDVCPMCPADINSNGVLTAADVVLLLNGVFVGAFAP